MDTPRRWQVASVATAVASLGIGGAFLARPDTASVPSIQLDDVDTTERGDGPTPTTDLAEDPAGPSIVLPRSVASPPAPTTASSTGSPDDTGSESGSELPPAPASADEPTPTTSNTGGTNDAGASPDVGDSPDDPGGSPDGGGSVDSAD